MDSLLNIAPQLFINVLISGSIYALASSGLSLSYGVSRILNFAHGQTLMIGAYLFLLFTELGASFAANTAPESQTLTVSIFAMASALAGTAVLGAVLYTLFIAPFHGKSSLLPFVATVAAGKILENGVAIVFGVNLKSISSNVESIDLGFGFITPSQIFTILSAWTILLLLVLLVTRSKFGRQMRAVQSAPFAASALGINAAKVNRSVFVISAMLAAFAGVLVGYETSLQPTMGGSYMIKALAVLVLGGLGNMWGAVIASYFLALLETIIVGVDFGSFSLPIGYRDGVAFVVILAVLLWRPAGLLGNKNQRGAV